MSFGLETTGFSLKSLTDILTALRTKQQALFGAAFAAQLDTSVVGQLNGVYANEIADLWLLAQSIYRARYPSTATGQALDLIGEETGATRLQATQSTVTLTFTGTNATVIPVGTIVSVATTDARFVTIEAGLISGTTDSVAAESEDFGPILAPAGTLTNIVTPISGITSVTNALDADIGQNEETDAAFRLRRAGLLRVQGEATIASIRADLLALDDVDEVKVFNNPTDVTDGDGIPPHSFEAVVRGGDDQDIFDEILDSQPAGIQSYGTEVGSSEDVMGDSQVVKFSRAVDVEMYAEVTLTYDPDVYGGGVQATGDAAVKQAIVDYWEAFDERLGKDVITNAFYGTIYAVPGVLEITLLEVDDTTPTTGTATTTVTSREIAVFDTSRVTVTST